MYTEVWLEEGCREDSHIVQIILEITQELLTKVCTALQTRLKNFRHKVVDLSIFSQLSKVTLLTPDT